jgi:hypothetical protein
MCALFLRYPFLPTGQDGAVVTFLNVIQNRYYLHNKNIKLKLKYILMHNIQNKI